MARFKEKEVAKMGLHIIHNCGYVIHEPATDAWLRRKEENMGDVFTGWAGQTFEVVKKKGKAAQAPVQASNAVVPLVPPGVEDDSQDGLGVYDEEREAYALAATHGVLPLIPVEVQEAAASAAEHSVGVQQDNHAGSRARGDNEIVPLCPPGVEDDS